jgi:hypothetical protein
MRLFLLVSLFGSSLFCQDSRRLCQVTFRVIDSAGVVQPLYKVTSFRLGDIDYSDRFDAQKGSVPCDIFAYTYELRRANAATPVISSLSSITGRMFVSQPETWLTLLKSPGIVISDDGTRGGVLNLAGNAGYVLYGRVTPSSSDPLWLRLTSIHDPADTKYGQIEAEIQASGDFRVHVPLHRGPYALAVSNERGKIVYFAMINPETPLVAEPLEIVIPAIPPEATVIR